MKKYLFIAASALALASCSSEDFVGTEGGNVETGANKAINFAGETGKTTRAANGNKVGADAAKLLGGSSMFWELRNFANWFSYYH